MNPLPPAMTDVQDMHRVCNIVFAAQAAQHGFSRLAFATRQTFQAKFDAGDGFGLRHGIEQALVGTGILYDDGRPAVDRENLGLAGLVQTAQVALRVLLKISQRMGFVQRYHDSESMRPGHDRQRNWFAGFIDGENPGYRFHCVPSVKPASRNRMSARLVDSGMKKAGHLNSRMVLPSTSRSGS